MSSERSRALRGDLRAIVVGNRNVVLADWCFTTPAVIVQPVTGVALAAAGLHVWSSGLCFALSAFVAGTIALAASWLSQHYATPVMLFALLLGMAFHFLHEEGRCIAGIEFCSRTILRFGIALLGLRITLAQIASLGTNVLIVIPGATTVSGVLGGNVTGAVENSRTSSLTLSAAPPSDARTASPSVNHCGGRGARRGRQPKKCTCESSCVSTLARRSRSLSQSVGESKARPARVTPAIPASPRPLARA